MFKSEGINFRLHLPSIFKKDGNHFWKWRPKWLKCHLFLFSPHYDVKYYNVQHVTIFRFCRSACSILCWEFPNIARFHQAWWSRVLAMLLGSKISMYRVAAVNCGSFHWNRTSTKIFIKIYLSVFLSSRNVNLEMKACSRIIFFFP